MLPDQQISLTCPNCKQSIATSANFCGECGASIVSSAKSTDPHIGKMVAGRYRIQRRLATGGMGEIYIAKHDTLNQQVAVKLLHRRYASDERIVKRFFNEARSFCRVKHPYAVGILDFGRLENGTLYLVTEYIEGKPLNLFVSNRNGLSAKVVVRLARQIAEVLAAAHEEQIIHRDLKPDNIIVTSGLGGRWSIKLLDFGIAKILDDEDTQGLTRTGSVFGTPEFMSPEQAQGLPVSFSGDIYSYGAVLFYMLAAIPPFTCKDRPKVLQLQISEPPPLGDLEKRDDIPLELIDLIGLCLEKKPDDRPDSFLVVLEALERIETVLTEQHESTGKERRPSVPAPFSEPWDDTDDPLSVEPSPSFELEVEIATDPPVEDEESDGPREGGGIEDLVVHTDAEGETDEGFSWGAEDESDIFAQTFDPGDTDLPITGLKKTNILPWIFVALGITVGAVAASFYLGFFDSGAGSDEGSGDELAPSEGSGDASNQVSLLSPAGLDGEGTGQHPVEPEQTVVPLPQRPFDIVYASQQTGLAATYIEDAEIEDALELWEGAVELLTVEDAELPSYPIAAVLQRATELMETADEYLDRNRCRRADQAIVEMLQISPALRTRYLRPLNRCWDRVHEEEEGQPPGTLGD